MFKGWVLILLLGVGFIYLVNVFLGQAESDPQQYRTKSSKSIDKENFDKYHKSDFNGDSVLDLSTLSLEEGKKVWLDSDVKRNIISNFPNFDMMIQMIDNQLVKSETKTFLLDKFNEVEVKYLSGDIDSVTARNILMYLRNTAP